MNSFVNNIGTQEARTANGMKALQGSGDACVDLFFQIGAMRGKNVIPLFEAAYADDKELALRIALWVRDVRGGAGERDLYRDILVHLERTDPDGAYLLINKTPLVGRWDDLFALSRDHKSTALQMVGAAIKSGDGLAAKWAPRKGVTANDLRRAMGLNPKDYRKLIVANSNTVEQQMCAKNWNEINFSHVPSRAAKIYRKAFEKNTPRYKEYVDTLMSQDPANPTVKINADAIFPHDVISPLFSSWSIAPKPSATALNSIRAQWDALPNFMGDENVLAVADVSGSMFRGASSVAPIQVSTALAIYVADKMSGAFKDTFMTFSSNPKLQTLRGDVVSKVHQMSSADWGMSTDLNKTFAKILDHAVKNDVPAMDMPSMVLILSDMQFDRCVQHDDSAMEMIRRTYRDNGYEVPQVVFWNLNSSDNVPVTMDTSGTALVSGYSPAIMKSVLAADMSEFTPKGIMLKTIMNEKYNLD